MPRDEETMGSNPDGCFLITQLCVLSFQLVFWESATQLVFHKIEKMLCSLERTKLNVHRIGKKNEKG